LRAAVRENAAGAEEIETEIRELREILGWHSAKYASIQGIIF